MKQRKETQTQKTTIHRTKTKGKQHEQEHT